MTKDSSFEHYAKDFRSSGHREIQEHFNAGYEAGLNAAADLIYRTDLGKLPSEWQLAVSNILVNYAKAIKELK